MTLGGTVGPLGAALLAAALAACGGGGGPTPSGDGGPGDDDDGSDGDDGDPSGLTVDFVYLGRDGEPMPIDQPIELDGLSISSLTIQLHRIRLTGDSSLGDELIAESGVLELPAGGAPRVTFPTAPPGLYSQLDWRVERTFAQEERPAGFEGRRLSIRVLGAATVEQGTLPFDYVDDKNVNVELRFAEEVQPDQPGQVAIELDLVAWFSVVDWQELADGQGGPGDDGGEDDQGEDDDSSGPGSGDDAGGSGGDGGPVDDDGGADDDGVLRIGRGGDQRVASDLRDSLLDAFRIVGP